MRTHASLIFKTLLLVGFSAVPAYAAGCGFTESGDYICGGNDENAPAVQNRTNPIPRPTADGNPVITDTGGGNSPTAGELIEGQETLRAAAERLQFATQDLSLTEQAAVGKYITDNNIPFEDIADFEGDLITGSGAGLTFMGIVIATAGTVLGGTGSPPDDGEPIFQAEINEGFEDEILKGVWTEGSAETVTLVDDPVNSGETAAEFGPGPSALESGLPFEANSAEVSGAFNVPEGENIGSTTIMQFEHDNGVPETSVTLNNNGTITLNHYVYDDDSESYVAVSETTDAAAYTKGEYNDISLKVVNGTATVSVNGQDVVSVDNPDGQGELGGVFSNTKVGKVSGGGGSTIYGDDVNIDLN